METTYRTNRGFRICCNTFAVFCTVTVVMIPFAIGAWWLAYKSRVVVRDDHLEVNWLGRRQLHWDEIKSITWDRFRGAGIGGMITRRLMKPLTCHSVAGPKRAGRIAIGCYENSDELLRTLSERTELQIAA